MMNGYVTSHAMRMPITSGVDSTNHFQQIALMPVTCFGSRVKITVRHLFAIGWSVSLPAGCRHQYGSVPMSLPRTYPTQVRMASIHTPRMPSGLYRCRFRLRRHSLIRRRLLRRPATFICLYSSSSIPSGRSPGVRGSSPRPTSTSPILPCPETRPETVKGSYHP